MISVCRNRTRRRRAKVVTAGSAIVALCLTSPSARGQDARVQASRCVVHADAGSLEELTLAVAGMPQPLDFDVSAVPLDVEPSGSQAHVHVSGALSFDATAQPTFSSTRALDLPSGFGHLPAHVGIAYVGPHDATLSGTVMLADELTLRDVPVACSDLALTAPPQRHARPTFATHGASVVFPTDAALTLHERPDGGAALEVVLLDPSDFAMRVLDRAGGWVRVARTDSDGFSLTGWVPAHAVSPRPTEFGGLVGTGVPDNTPFPVHSGARWYRGPATIAAGTRVFASAGVGPWGTWNGGAVEVLSDDTLAWVQILSVPGVRNGMRTDGLLMNAWVPRSAVTLPPTAHRGDVR